MTTKEVAALFQVHRNTLYMIPGLAACRVPLGIRAVRYDTSKVMALFTRRAPRKAA